MHMTAEQLKPNFEPFGNIEEVTIIYDKTTHLSKGCGFVTYSTEDAARAAIDALSEKCVLVTLAATNTPPTLTSPLGVHLPLTRCPHRPHARQNGKPLVVKFAEGLRQRMEHRLYVSNLPIDFDEEQTSALFSEHGEVKQLQLARRAEDNMPKGTAYVRYSKRTEAVAAIAALHGNASLPNAQRPLVVKFAERASDGNGNGGGNGNGANHGAMGAGGHMGGGGPYGQMGAPHMGGGPYMGGGAHGGPSAQNSAPKLFVGMIPYATGEAELQQLFSQFGPLMEVFMMREKDGRSKGCAFVRFYSKEAANAACLALNGTLALPGAARNLVVKYADASEPRNNRAGGGGGGGMRFPSVPEGGHMGQQHMAQQGFMPHHSLQNDGSQWIQVPANQRMVGAHPSAGGQMAMMGHQMVGMTLMPAQMGMAPVGMTSMLAAPYGATTMDGMGMMQAPMAAQYQVPQPSPQVQQFVPTYGGQPGGMMDPQQPQPQPGGGWGNPEPQGSPGGGFTTLADQQQLGVGDYGHGHRQDPNIGAFGAMQQLPPHCACGGGGGSFAMASGGGLGMLERQMSSTTLSSEDSSPPGSTWDRLCALRRPAGHGARACLDAH